MKLFFKCNEGGVPFAELMEALTGIEGVHAVSRLPGVQGCEEGLVELSAEAAIPAVTELIQKRGAELVKPRSLDAPVAKGRRGNKPAQADSITQRFFAKGGDDKGKSGADERRAGDQGQGPRRRDRRHGDSAPSDAEKQPSSGRARGGGRGGRGTGRGRGRGGRGRGFIMPQFVEGHVASINNVPVSMTNDQIAEAFADCGTIYDIARYETLAMVYFDSAESVLEAICKVNGKALNGNIVTVSDGGILRVPIPQSLILAQQQAYDQQYQQAAAYDR